MLRVGIAGLGFMGMIHYLSYQKVRGVKVAAICEQQRKRLTGDWRDIKGNFGPAGRQMDLAGVATYDDLDAMLDDPAIDLIDITLPPALHADIACRALRKGKHVFCEKPMALKLGDAHRMAEACERHGVRLTIGFVRRFDPFWGCMRKIVESGVLGGPVIWRSVSAGHQNTVWMRNIDKGGGPLMDGGIHNYDFALQMLGPAESVQASSMLFDTTSVGTSMSPRRSHVEWKPISRIVRM